MSRRRDSRDRSSIDRSRTPPDINHLFSIKVDNLSYRTTLAVVER